MKETTLTALKGSIEKWKSIAAGTAENLGMANCPLCKEFNTYRFDNYPIRETMEPNCGQCPVKLATGRSGCEGSPYNEFEEQELDGNLYEEDEDGDFIRDKDGILRIKPLGVELANKEIAFLRSLLPVEAEGEVATHG